MRFPSLLLLTLLAACSSLTARVQGKVVDDKDQPVAGARVSLGMYPSSDQDPEAWLESDANGEFDGLITFRHKSGSPVRALDPGGKWGGIAHINRHRDPVTIVVQPLTKVQGRVSYDKIPPSVRKWTESNAFEWEGSRPKLGSRLHVLRKPPAHPKHPEYVISGKAVDGKFEFMLPAGTYEIRFMGVHDRLEREFTVTPGADVDLGLFEAVPTPEQAMFGAPPPELKLADARGIPKDFQWSSVRGKWVILFLWDYRNRANNWLSGLVQTWKDWEKHRDKVEIIAVHNCDTVLTVADLERYLQWEVEDRDFKFPFPVAIDDDEKTFVAFQLTEGPKRLGSRLLVINPDGNVEFTGRYMHGFQPVEYVRRKLEPQNP